MRRSRTNPSLRAVGVMAAAALVTVALPLVALADYQTTPRETWSANKPVYAISVTDDRTYIGGAFTVVKNIVTKKTVSRTAIAAIDNTSGDLITSFNVAITGNVRAVAVSDDGDTVYLGGDFSSVNGQSLANLAAVDAYTGDLVQTWSTTASGMVRDLVWLDGALYVAGTFGKINNVVRGGLAKLSPTGQLLTWKTSFTGGKPRSITPATNGTDLVVAGSFLTIGGLSRPFLGSVSLATAAVSSWNPPEACSNCEIFDVTTEGDAVYGAVGGGGGRAVKWSATGNQILWNVKGDGNLQAVDVADGVVYVGGHFGPTFAGQPRGQLAALSATNGSLLPFAPDLGTQYSPGVWAIDAGPDFLRVGGGFLSVNGVNRARYAEFPIE